MVPRVVHPILMGSRVTQVDMTPEYFAEAAGQARGPPTLEWCQAVALCTSCTWQGEQCEFEEPVLGCSVTLNWCAACIAAEQGWDHEWVAAQLEEGRRGRVSGRGSGVEGGVGVGRPPRGGQREGAPMTHDKGKWRAFSLPEVGPSKWAREELAMVGPLGPMVYSPTSRALVEQSAEGLWSVAEAFLRHQAEELERLLATRGEEVRRVGEERDGLWRELDEARKEWDLVPSRAVSAHEAIGGVGRGGRATIGGVRDAGDSVGVQCRGDPSDGGEGAAAGRVACQQGGLGVVRSALLGQRALHPPQQSISGTGVHPQWVGEDAWGSPTGFGAGGHADGASAGRTSAEGDSRPQSMVGGGNGRGGAAPGASQSSGDGSSAAGGGSGGKDSRGGFGGGEEE
ncbi:hypothetical protein E4T56_gene18464 [Termitomyces sp. T112]|nr:hypothetical protein E4T56_gene18464 [Termitomyces sp. T112]